MNIRSAIFTFVVFMLCGYAFDGTAQSHHYELRVGDFDNLKILDNVNVEWRCNPDSTGMVTFYSPKEYVDAFILSNNGKGTLKVQASTEALKKGNLPTLTLYSDFLTYVGNYSSADVRVINPPACAQFKVTQEGNGHVTVEGLRCTTVEAKLLTGKGVVSVSGECGTAKLSLTGTGEIRADELKATDVKCSFRGTGAIFCYPVEKLSTKGIGTTKIYYKGLPEEILKKGGGTVEQF